MKTLTNRLFELNVEGENVLKRMFKKRKEIVLLDINADTDVMSEEELDAFDCARVELPAQFYYTKYNYAVLYYLHRIYMENDKIYVEGRDWEEGEDYTFSFGEINSDNFIYLVDCAIDIIN